MIAAGGGDVERKPIHARLMPDDRIPRSLIE
jgi:hypothetical protein